MLNITWCFWMKSRQGHVGNMAKFYNICPNLQGALHQQHNPKREMCTPVGVTYNLIPATICMWINEKYIISRLLSTSEFWARIDGIYMNCLQKFHISNKKFFCSKNLCRDLYKKIYLILKLNLNLIFFLRLSSVYEYEG